MWDNLCCYYIPHVYGLTKFTTPKRIKNVKNDFRFGLKSELRASEHAVNDTDLGNEELDISANFETSRRIVKIIYISWSVPVNAKSRIERIQLVGK